MGLPKTHLGQEDVDLNRFPTESFRIWMAHLLRSAVPALLIALLGIVKVSGNAPHSLACAATSRKDPWLALVVGANCFLPEFCAGFGKYLVCYRVEKALL